MKMKITLQNSAEKITDYLHHKISVEELVDWAETAMMEGEFEDEHCEILREIVSRMGLADVRAFGLTWDDCEDFLDRLGYKASITVKQATATSG